MTAPQPSIKAAAVREDAAGTTAVESPLFLAPPSTDKASARAAVIAEACAAAADDKPSSPPVLRFSAGS